MSEPISTSAIAREFVNNPPADASEANESAIRDITPDMAPSDFIKDRASTDQQAYARNAAASAYVLQQHSSVPLTRNQWGRVVPMRDADIAPTKAAVLDSVEAIDALRHNLGWDDERINREKSELERDEAIINFAAEANHANVGDGDIFRFGSSPDEIANLIAQRTRTLQAQKEYKQR